MESSKALSRACSAASHEGHYGVLKGHLLEENALGPGHRIITIRTFVLE